MGFPSQCSSPIGGPRHHRLADRRSRGEGHLSGPVWRRRLPRGGIRGCRGQVPQMRSPRSDCTEMESPFGGFRWWWSAGRRDRGSVVAEAEHGDLEVGAQRLAGQEQLRRPGRLEDHRMPRACVVAHESAALVKRHRRQSRIAAVHGPAAPSAGCVRAGSRGRVRVRRRAVSRGGLHARWRTGSAAAASRQPF
jgi:hypothetical protein